MSCSAWAVLLLGSIVHAYCTEKLPITLVSVCDDLLRPDKASSVKTRTAKKRCVGKTLNFLMKVVAWLGFLQLYVVLWICFVTMLCWLVFGVVVQPKRFVPLASTVFSFILGIGARLMSLRRWRRAFAVEVQKLAEACLKPMWACLAKRLSLGRLPMSAVASPSVASYLTRVAEPRWKTMVMQMQAD